MNDFVAGLLGGTAGLVVGHPLDTIKAIMQTRNEKSMFSTSRHLLKDSNLKGFFRGLSMPLASYGLINSLLFGVYGNTIKWLNNGEINNKPSFTSVWLAGTISGCFICFPNNPLEVIKLQLQTHGTGEIKGLIDCSKKIVQRDGYKGFFKGLNASLMRDAPSYGIYFLIFEVFKQKMLEKGVNNQILIELIGGGLAGSISWFSIMPFDVVKSRMQADISSKNQSFSAIFKSLKTEYGLRGYFKGLSPVLIRGFLVNAITFCVHQRSLEFFNNRHLLEQNSRF